MVPSGGAGGGTIDGQSGTGGSFARFSVIDDHMYVLSDTELISYDLADPTKPAIAANTFVGWNIETIFPHGDHLFIGGQAGMYIYDRTNPAEPFEVSRFEHARACDPVFVQNDVAYVTLRNGTVCQGFINQMEVIDISDLSSPTLIKSYEMENPHGLALRGQQLYLCEGAHGIKVFDTEDLENIDGNQLDKVEDVHAFDAISLSASHLLVIGDDGLYQYDSSDPSDLTLLSSLKTQ